MRVRVLSWAYARLRERDEEWIECDAVVELETERGVGDGIDMEWLVEEVEGCGEKFEAEGTCRFSEREADISGAIERDVVEEIIRVGMAE